MSSPAANPNSSLPSLKRRFFSLRRSSRSPLKSVNKDAVASSSSDADGHNSFRADVKKTFDGVSQLLKASAGPVHAKYPYVLANNPDPPNGNLLADLKTIGFQDVETLLQSFYDQAKGVQDDNTLLLEHLVQLLSKLPADSKDGKLLTDGLINQLWGALPHPPATSLGTKYKYREPDGSNNNINNPKLGAANTPYARSAKPSALQNIALPDPGQIFDTLMARGDKFEPHPNGISSVLFYLASIIIHDLFRTVGISIRLIEHCIDRWLRIMPTSTTP
jgi:linoleate 8R-lipoxygenase/9,12-octadecadienoate 8-hydroperoxide 8R-isomerase